MTEYYVSISHYSGKYRVEVDLNDIFPIVSKIVSKEKIPEGFGHAFEVHCPAVSGLSGFVSESNLRTFFPEKLKQLEEMARNGKEENLVEDWLGNDVY